ncbi:helix-turn-helix domain-containing protein [Nocardioides zeae]
MSETVGMVGRAAGVLRALAELDAEGARTADVARVVGLPRPTVHRVLTALLEEGLVDRVHETGRWHLGPELFVLGAAAARRYDVAQVAHPTVRRLAELTGRAPSSRSAGARTPSACCARTATSPSARTC